MGIPELPAPVSIFREPRRERIDSQIVSPFEFDMFEGARKILNGRRRGRTIRKHQMAVRGHEERWIFREMLPPGCRTVVSNVVRHGLHEPRYAVLYGGRLCRGQRFRHPRRDVLRVLRD